MKKNEAVYTVCPICIRMLKRRFADNVFSFYKCDDCGSVFFFRTTKTGCDDKDKK